MGTLVLPENLRRAQDSSGIVSRCVVATENSVSESVTGPGQGALEGAPQVVEGPGYDHVVVEAHQRGHAQHPDANPCRRRAKKSKNLMFSHPRAAGRKRLVCPPQTGFSFCCHRSFTVCQASAGMTSLILAGHMTEHAFLVEREPLRISLV